jgi:tripartite-type tricarboxylate transporter receptor subunit TctC
VKVHISRREAMSLVGAYLGAMATGDTLAQTADAWPRKAVTIVVPGAPGGTLDIPTRVIAQKLSVRLGQPVVVDSKAGSGGILGTQTMLRAPADGYTLLSGNTGPQAINYSAYRNLPYKPDELSALTDVISFANVLVVNAASPYRSVVELVAAGKKEPGKLFFGSAGVGQTTHLSGELFNNRTGIAALHVPYRGSVPATTALLAGETTFQFDNATQVLSHIQAGKLRPLAVTTEERIPSLPNVPTMSEAGMPDFISYGWMGIFVSSKTPQDIQKKLTDHLIAVMQDSEVIAQLKQLGGIPGGRSQAQFSAFVATERSRWGEAAKTLNLSVD